MNRYTLPTGAVRYSAVDVDAWIPDPSVLTEAPADQRLLLAIEYAEAAHDIQAAAHPGVDELRECCQSDCWITHLDAAIGGGL